MGRDGAETGQPTPAALTARDFRAIDAGDLDTVVDLAHEDVVEEFLALGLVLRGRAELRAFFAELFAAVEDLRFETLDVHGGDGEVAVGQWRLRGRFSGGPFQGIAATGRAIDLRGVDVMRWRDGRLVHNTIYYDGMTFARQAGLLPAAGGVADRVMLASLNGITRTRAGLRDLVRRRAGPGLP